jgi:dihydrodipicolinate synthase/N-acetylneuraminate lyase
MTFEPSPILGTAVLPWDANGQLDEPRLVSQVAQLTKTLTRHLYIFGTAGEGYAVSDAQFRQVSTCFAKCASVHQARPMIGVISLSLATIIERIEFGRGLGFGNSSYHFHLGAR